MPKMRVATVAQLQAEGILLVEDGNHGEDRPRPEEFVAIGTAFIRATDMDAGSVLFETAGKINDTALTRIRKGIGKPGDILFSHKGTVGKLARVPEDSPAFVCSPQTTFWRTLDANQLDQGYLYYFMASNEFREQWASRKGETDMADYVSLTAQRELRISIPDIDDQRVIARALGVLDAKILLNRKITYTLEGLSRALFKSWFVDFDPVQAKRDGRKPRCMDNSVATLFPHHFDDSVLGPVPKGWSIRGLDQVASFLNGLALQKYPPMDGATLPVVKIAELRTEDTNDSERASLAVPSAYIIDDGDIIFSWSGSLTVVVWCGGKGALNQHLFRVASKDYPKWFYWLWIDYHLPEFQAIAADKATTMGHIKRHHLHDAKVVVPTDDVLRAADAIISKWFDLIVHNKTESRTLARLRDTMLPRLISREIHLRDAEREFEAVL